MFDEPFYVYASLTSDLARKQAIAEADLQDGELLLLTEGHCMREQMLKVCRHRNQAKGNPLAKVSFESGSIETLCHLVEKGHGYTVIPHLAKTWQEYRGGKVIPFMDPSPSREVSLVVHRSFVRESLLQALTQSIKASLPPELVASHSHRTIGIR